ncbi:MAG: putative DNA binding domain-containing protein [Kiritimatiellae bacterium]|nr:putative DNA binding domain-containing protein [Kiritimatiellia bacterium]
MNLIAEIQKGESDRLEFKEVPSERSDKWLKTAVAFANCRGGRILFGVSNSREVKGLDGDLFAIRDAITDAIVSSCQPTLPAQVSITMVNGKPIIVLDVQEGVRTPYFIKAKGDVDGVYVRYDATTRIADEYALQDLRVEGSGKSYDSRECRGLEVTPDEIDALCKRMYELAQANTVGEAERKLIKPVTPTQLVKWGILRDIGGKLRPTNAFALLTDSDSISPVVKCGLFRGKTRAVFIDRRQFVMPIQDQIDEAYKYVLSKINLGATFPNVRRKDTYEIPPGAIRELIANAVLHRTYVNAETSPITVAIYDDRLEVTSPGKLKCGITVEKMQVGCSDCRNEALALALSYMNIIEDWGSGIPRIREELRGAGLQDIVIDDWPNAVRATIYRQRVESGAETPQKTQPQKSSQKGSQKSSQKGSQKGSQKSSQKGSQKSSQKIIATISDNTEITIRELASMLGISQRAVSKHISSLQTRGYLRRIGPDKGGHWEVIDK